MNMKKERDPLFEVLRDSPTEFSLQEIDRMVVGFPLLPTPFDWSTIINLKSIIMTSISVLFLAGAISLLSGSNAPSTTEVKSYQEEATTQLPNLQNEELSKTVTEPTSPVEPETSPNPPDPIEAISPLNPTLPVVRADQNPILSEAVPNSPLNTEKVYNLKDFHSVSLSTSVDVIIKQGAEFSVKAIGDPDLIQELDLKVKGGNLEIGANNGKWSWNSKYKPTSVHITMPYLDELSLAGSGDMTFEGFDSADEMHLSLAGSGNISSRSPIDIAKNIKVSVAGSGDISVSGTAQMSNISVAGSGDFHGENLRSNHAKVSIAGSGDVFISCDEELDVSIAGSGDVNYSGNAHVSKSIVGSGDVNHR
jgi:hypothetical protein